MLLRVFAVFVAAEVSGFAHLATDVYESLCGIEHRDHDDCDDEGAGHECPPGCPNCHHAHSAVVLSVLVPEARLEPVARNEQSSGFVPYREMVPSGVDPGSVYRPPRLPA